MWKPESEIHAIPEAGNGHTGLITTSHVIRIFVRSAISSKDYGNDASNVTARVALYGPSKM